MKKIILLLLFLGCFVAISKRVCAADLTIDALGIAWDATNRCFTLTWDSVDVATTTAGFEMRYDVFADSGVVVPTTFIDRVNSTTYDFYPSTYSRYSFLVTSTDTFPASTASSSPLRQGDFMYDFTRADQSGSQVGYGQMWKYTFKMIDDASLYVAVYPNSVVYPAADSVGFVGVPTSAPTKVLHDFVPFSVDAGGSWENEVWWDCRDSNGALVANDMYRVYFQAVGKHGDIVDALVGSFPVDIMRFLSLSAESITAVNSLGKINYDINADCLVTVLICSPGTTFTSAASAGTLTYLTNYTYTYTAKDALPLNTSGAVDGGQIIRILSFYREDGSHSEEWDGTDATGAVASDEVYSFAIFAKDDYSNYALDTTGNDYYIWDTISVDRTFVPTGGGGTSDTSRPNVIAFSPIDGVTYTSILSSVTVILNDGASGSGVSVSNTTIVLLDSSGSTVPGTQSNGTHALGTQFIYTLSPVLTRANNGTYTISVVPVDLNSNGLGSTPVQAAFTLTIDDPEVFATGTEVYVYPNPIKSTAAGIFAFTLNRSATVRLRIFNILGELVLDKSAAYAAGAQTYAWDLKNNAGKKVASGVYIYRIEGNDGASVKEFVKKLILIQ